MDENTQDAPTGGKNAGLAGGGATEDDDFYDGLDEDPCSWCCGDGTQDPDDPLFEGRDPIACKACGGTGLASKQTIW